MPKGISGVSTVHIEIFMLLEGAKSMLGGGKGVHGGESSLSKYLKMTI